MHEPVPPRLQDLADRLGVTKAAVSLALRNQPGVSAELRAAVKALAAKLDYRASPLLAVHMAQVRARRRPHYRATLALLSNQPGGLAGAKRSPRDLRYWRGALNRARQQGYELELFSTTTPGMSEARLGSILANRGICGVVVGPLAQPHGVVRLPWRLFASVAIGYSLHEPILHRVGHDNFETMTALLSECAARGYRRIGLAVAAVDNLRVNHLWVAGYLAGRYRVPTATLVPPLVTADWNRATFLRWFQRHRPDAVICISPQVVAWLRAAKVTVPGRVGVATAYWMPENAELAGFDQDFEKIGAAAVDLVIAQLQRNERGLPDQPSVLLLRGTWREGASLRSAIPR